MVIFLSLISLILWYQIMPTEIFHLFILCYYIFSPMTLTRALIREKIFRIRYSESTIFERIYQILIFCQSVVSTRTNSPGQASRHDIKPDSFSTLSKYERAGQLVSDQKHQFFDSQEIRTILLTQHFYRLHSNHR